jgi:hypothetical protein
MSNLLMSAFELAILSQRHMPQVMQDGIFISLDCTGTMTTSPKNVRLWDLSIEVENSPGFDCTVPILVSGHSHGPRP